MITGWGFDQAVVINREDRPDRLARFVERWQGTPLAPMPLRTFTAHTGSNPTAACLASHLDVLATSLTSTLVLEDDAIFGPGFPWPAQNFPPNDWGVLWLGAQHISLPRPATRGWVQPVEIMRTHAYVARYPPSLAAMLRFVNPPRIDPYLARLGLPQYVADPQTVGQDAGPSDTGGPARGEAEFWHLGG